MGQKKNIHHGKFIEELIDRSVKKTTEIIDLSGYSRSSVYRWFKEEKLDMEKVHRIAIACGINIEGELPELDYYRKVRQKDEQIIEPKEKSIPQNRYVELLEELNDARQQANEYQMKYFQLKERMRDIEKSKDQKD